MQQQQQQQQEENVPNAMRAENKQKIRFDSDFESSKTKQTKTAKCEPVFPNVNLHNVRQMGSRRT